MDLTYREVREQVLKLGRDEQALLAEELLSNLNANKDENYEEEWLKEATSRYQAYKEGKIKTIPAAEVHRRILESRKR
jgi:putative addiction module component (TIGR02574 family)